MRKGMSVGIAIAIAAATGGYAVSQSDFWRDVALSKPETDCQHYVLTNLKSPASYKRVSSSVVTISTDAPALPADSGMTLPKAPYDLASIEFDSMNAFGAVIRGKAYCQYLHRTDPRQDAIRLSQQVF